jgi:Ca2+-binding EF-hand superfamily protein
MQKSNGVQNEEAVLLKAFKYFDLNNNGTVEPEEFAKAVEKIGIMIPTKQVSSDSIGSVRQGAFCFLAKDTQNAFGGSRTTNFGAIKFYLF